MRCILSGNYSLLILYEENLSRKSKLCFNGLYNLKLVSLGWKTKNDEDCRQDGLAESFGVIQAVNSKRSIALKSQKIDCHMF